MAVLVECQTVVVRVETLREKYPGGPEAYCRACPNQTLRSDGRLVAIGFMTDMDVEVWVARLALLGLRCKHEGRFEDIAVVEQSHGLRAPCDWLLAGKHSEGFDVAFLKGTEPGAVAFPPGWERDTMIPLDDADVEFLGMQGGLMTCRRRTTGQLLYQASPFVKTRES
jgi:hypothetical protein